MTTRYAPQIQKNWLLRFTSTGEIVRRLVFLISVLLMLALGSICFIEAANWIDKPFAGFLMNRKLTVLSLGMPDWAGTQAGLQSADRIIKIGDQVITQVSDLETMVKNSEIGDLLDYTVDRGGVTMTVPVPVSRFTLTDFLGTFGSTFLQGVIFFVIGVIVFLLKPDSAVSVLFFFATMLLAASNFVDFSVSSRASPFSYLVIISDNTLSALALHFSALFPFRHELFDHRPWLFLIPYLLSALIIVPLLLLYPGPAFYQAYGPLSYSYVYFAVACFLGTSIYTYFRSVSSLARQRARVIFWGALLAFPLPMLVAILANTGSIDIPIFTNLTALPAIIFPVAIAYSITRHNLFDVDIYIKRTVGYGLMTVLLGATYFGIQLLLEGLLLSDSAQKLSPVIFALLVVIFFNPVNRRIQIAIDRLFFRKKFDYKEAVNSISDALSSVLNLKEIVGKINDAIRKEMFIDNAGVIVLSQHGNHHGYFSHDQRQDEAIETQSEIAEADSLVNLVIQRREMITRYDISENPVYRDCRKECLEHFTKLGATILMPMIYQGQVKAIIAIGRKKSGQFFSKDDVELLSALASHGAISIENARLAEQMTHEESVRTNLSRYLSPQIVEGIVNSNVEVNLGGDRKVVTILFSDIRDFTSITENQPPDKLVRMLNEYFTAMAECIFVHQGSLDKYIGDAIVAVFGSLIPLDNPENHAAQASIEMMHRLQKLNEIWSERGDFSMQMGIGICTGEVFLGNVGSNERMEFTVIGDTVNMASRLSGVAKGGQIVITESVKSHLGSSFNIQELPPVVVKGKQGQHVVYEVVYC
ncbi:MAG: adenylate/guanylate cyclase domain-containing protein [Desulfuromonadales bacterium]|nr:adenylate/guanylate cyclase domain-containing protein [Desulfuromonadales bacterium]